MPVDNRACDRLNGFMHAGFLHLGLLLTCLIWTSVSGQPQWAKRIQGSPDPALLFVAKRVWPDLPVKKPIDLKVIPGRPDWMAYADHHESKESISSLWVFEAKADVKQQVEALTLPNRLIYGFCFHPLFEQNGYVYLHTNGPRRGEGSKSKFSQVTRWTLDRHCLLYTSPSPRDAHESRMPSSA